MAAKTKKSAGTDPINLPRLKPGVTSATPATGKSVDATLTNSLTSYFNTTLAQLRATGQTLKAIRTLARVHGDVSAAVAAVVRLADTPIRIRVYDSLHQLSPDGSNLMRSVLVRFNNYSDYKLGFDDRMPMTLAKTSLLRSIPLTGACALELVLDKAGLPYRLQPVSVEEVKFKVGSSTIGSSNKITPFQTTSAGEVSLDIATFFYSALDQDLSSAYSYSPLEPAINTSFHHAETVDDIRRVVKRSGHSRLVVKLLTEKLISSAPLDIRSDPTKLAEWVEKARVDVKNEIEKLSPESALVLFDTMEAEYLNSEIGASADYKPLMETIDSILATALKTPAAIVGKRTTGGSQNTSSTESLLFIKTAEGLHAPVEAVLSKAMTLAIRLFGFDGYATVTFEPIDLRPKIELEAFKSMEQTRILEQLSLGFLSDDEAAELLGTGPRAPGAPPLSGTLFTQATSATPPSPNGDPARRALVPDTPSSSGGKDQSKKP
jgi:hypothetical protein